MLSLPQNIVQLINSHKEGSWWDFKQTHHGDKGKLIHDILCLANTCTYTDKYLIFGITDEGICVSIEKNEQLQQPDLLDLLSNVHFSGRQPSVSIQYFVYQSKEIGVLTIKDEPYKPFFLSKTYQKNSTKVPAGAIFNRTECKNTPINENAKEYDIEEMWRERFKISKKSRMLFEGMVYDDFSIIIAAQIHSYDYITLTFIDTDKNASVTTNVDVKDICSDSYLRVVVGSHIVQLKHEECYEEGGYSLLMYKPEETTRNKLRLKRVTGTPKLITT